MNDPNTFDPAEFFQLPGATGHTPRFGRPCGDCGATRFQVVRVWRKSPSGEKFAAVESRCPHCPLLGDKPGTKPTVLGIHDLLTGEFRPS